jgi:hypothetical protein
VYGPNRSNAIDPHQKKEAAKAVAAKEKQTKRTSKKVRKKIG